jgi:hypothetical protein
MKNIEIKRINYLIDIKISKGYEICKIDNECVQYICKNYQ